MDDPTIADAYAAATAAVTSLTSNLPDALKAPMIAAICGSGLGGLADSLHAEPRHEVAYGEIPHFPPSTGTCG
jgi:purine-nucleoside phosphorylase